MGNEIKVGDYVRVKTNAKGTTWEYGYVVRIEDGKALINYGNKDFPIYGLGIMERLEDLELVRTGNIK